MKTWNAPEMEELDVRMTLNGTNTSYEESWTGWEAYCVAHGIEPANNVVQYKEFMEKHGSVLS